VSSVRFRPRVAFQGQPGAFSEDAAIKLLGEDIELVPRATFGDLFQSIDDKVADYAIAPIENSLAGTIQPCRDLLYRSSLVITGEVIIPIAQQLIAAPGASFDNIESVESHPVALAQCEHFFAAYPQLRRVEADDTAGSVARVLESGDLRRAAVAGKRAAELYGGQILKENIQDDRNNYTRFLLLSSAEFIRQAGRLVLDQVDVERKGPEALRSFFVAANSANESRKKE
jgi:prephenate dehydratase